MVLSLEGHRRFGLLGLTLYSIFCIVTLQVSINNVLNIILSLLPSYSSMANLLNLKLIAG